MHDRYISQWCKDHRPSAPFIPLSEDYETKHSDMQAPVLPEAAGRELQGHEAERGARLAEATSRAEAIQLETAQRPRNP